jgi:hypothetical protein
MVSIDLPKHWKELQTKMQGELQAARKQPHCGSSGDSAETSWMKFFETYLPGRFSVMHDATIIDSRGESGQQIDLAIYDKLYTPKIWQYGDKSWIPAESVYCVVECKEKVQSRVSYAGDKIASVRNLFRTTDDFHVNPDGIRPGVNPKPILGILVADVYGWKSDNTNSLISALKRLTVGARIDFICSVDGFSAHVLWDSNGNPELNIESGDTALISFLTELDRALRMQGTVAPIDYRQYLRPSNV